MDYYLFLHRWVTNCAILREKAAQTKLILTYALGHRDQGYNKGEKQGPLDSIHFDSFQEMCYNKFRLSLCTKHFVIKRINIISCNKARIICCLIYKYISTTIMFSL